MPEQVTIAQQVSIRDAGFDEYWLQDQIYENPAALQLGELEAIAKERQQASGGRLDLLLKNPEDDSMYEVEIMLGETDESHIIRTIEYWDNEKRRWPQRQHFAVLVAEHINRRFFNVIHLLSHSIPIIAIQVSMLQNGNAKTLYFSKVLDTFEEVDDGTSLDDRTYNREYWEKRSKATIEAAESMVDLTKDVFNGATLHFLKYYVAINADGYHYFFLHKRSGNKSLLNFRMRQSRQDEVASLLDSATITYVKKPKWFAITIDKLMLEKNEEVFKTIANLVKQSRGADG